MYQSIDVASSTPSPIGKLSRDILWLIFSLNADMFNPLEYDWEVMEEYSLRFAIDMGKHYMAQKTVRAWKTWMRRDHEANHKCTSTHPGPFSEPNVLFSNNAPLLWELGIHSPYFSLNLRAPWITHLHILKLNIPEIHALEVFNAITKMPLLQHLNITDIQGHPDLKSLDSESIALPHLINLSIHANFEVASAIPNKSVNYISFLPGQPIILDLTFHLTFISHCGSQSLRCSGGVIYLLSGFSNSHWITRGGGIMNQPNWPSFNYAEELLKLLDFYQFRKDHHLSIPTLDLGNHLVDDLAFLDMMSGVRVVWEQGGKQSEYICGSGNQWKLQFRYQMRRCSFSPKSFGKMMTAHLILPYPNPKYLNALA
ncbi:hypothetical protein CPB84DRAFT_1751531 [Gymnopilus junonius]|uniref:Uncharacterized protein n=1 Tax=Gymnopilus junonius TaxID=109634 RepID=A0A9P5TI02_GYMJU|nr:hypothetical protein CPB84DRAFT_1751531 [Gymnopilus junonius]